MGTSTTAMRWMHVVLGVLLALGALYIFVIARFSPHPLPGLLLIALSVFAAGLMTIARSTRFRRLETGLCFVAVLLAAGGFAQIAVVGTGRPAAAAPGRGGGR